MLKNISYIMENQQNQKKLEKNYIKHVKEEMNLFKNIKNINKKNNDFSFYLQL